MARQFNQLHRFGLLKFNMSTSFTEVKLDAGIKPEVIIILANHNPRSSKLKSVLSDPQLDKFSRADPSLHFDLRFFCVPICRLRIARGLHGATG